MRLKQCIFALMAMLLCAFSANAQSDGVAKIGSTTYATFAEALTAASAMSGDVTIEVHDKVTLNTAFSGSYSSINFVGKDTDAEIYLDVQGYITATGKKVSFTDLTLSKSAGGFITNAGFMNVAFGIYDVVEVAYTNCVFANGAYASSGNVTFNGCTFYRSHDKYGLWAYGDVNATVEDCTFADYRGIKMYAEGAAKTVDLTVKNTDFSAVTDKPAIVLTYGESVVLEGNTYSSTGTFELDLDGAPNGTAVTSDVAPTCENDNGTCGVLVDGKIYTTVAQAAEVAAEGSNVTLLYSTTDAVEFAEGVNLTLANGVIADNVTVATSGVAKIGDVEYATLAEAVAAAESGATITLMNGEHELPLFSDKELTFVGESKEGVIVNDAPDARVQGWNGSTFHFENLTAKGATENYHGLANGVVAVTYKDCNINGLRFLYATEGVSFEDCAFNAQGVEHSFWTYGASNVTVKNSTFTYTDRAVNCYSENGANHEAVIAFEGCSFTYAGTEDAPEGAVEINSGSSKSIELTMNGCTAPEKGAMWFNSQWDGKKGENTVVAVNGEIVWQVLPAAKVNGVEYKSLQAALDAAAAGTGDVTVEILRDVDLTGIDWNPVTVSAPGYPVVTVEGNNKTITGLNDMLFAGTWAGGSGLIIKNLTIDESAIVNDKDDANGTVGVGAFIGFPQASATITLENCHLKNSSVEGGHWTGGLIGYAAGYAGEDGPVFMNLTVKNCSVTGSTITGKGSVGGIIGHGSGNGWTNVVIEETTVQGNTITSTGSSAIKAGAIMGTIGAAGQPTTANGVTKTGGATVSATVAGNTVTSNGTAITTIYGRQGTSTGMLYLNGGTYDNNPIEENVAYAKPAEGYKIVKNDDNTYGVVVDPAYGKVAMIGETYYETLDAAFAAAQDNDEVKVIADGTYALTTSGKNITITGVVDGVVFDNIGAKNMGSANVTFNNVTFDYYPNVNYTGLQHSGNLKYNDCIINGQVFLYGTSETFNNCTFNQNSADAYNVWTYGAKEVAFNECTFNSVGKSVLVYTESATTTNDVTVTKCAFNASAPVEGKAAIEIDTSLSAGATITVDGETTATGFGSGNVSGNSLWNNKKGNADAANNDVTVVVNGETVLAPIPDVAKIGETGYRTLAEAIAAIGAGDVVIELLADVTFDYNARDAYGTAETTSVTINGNGHTLTLNQKDSDWASIGLANAAGKLAFNNVIIEKTGYGDTNGAWNTHAIIFSCPVEMTDVTVNQSMAVQAGATLNNVTINEANGYYGLWINGNGQSVTVNGGAINATNGGRGIKIADEYIDAPAQVTLSVTGTKFSTAKKAAVLVSSKAGADIAACNVNIENVAEDKVNFVWVDEDWAQYFANVTVTGATVALESMGDFAVTINNSAYFKTIAKAIEAAQPDDVITFLQDITENVTINKNVTIDGAKKNYTGTISISGSSNTIKDINFVGTADLYYSLAVRNAKTLIIEDCTVKNYKSGFLYVPKATNIISVKNVTVENCPEYAVYFASGVTTATFENLTVKNSNNGFVINNTAKRAFTIKDCTMENVNTAINHSNGTSDITCTALGVNDFGGAALSEYAKLIGATITGTTYYGSVKGMVEKAVTGQTVQLLSNITLDATGYEMASCDGYPSFVHVEGKAITVDLNGKTITADVDADDVSDFVIGVFSTDNGGELILVDNSAERTGTVKLEAEDGKVYSLICNYNPGCKITVEGGTYVADKVNDCLIFSGAREDALITVNGGNFTLGNVGTGENGKPWIFNVLGQNQGSVLVNGGTFNADVNHQFWAHEVFVPETKALKNNGDGTWTVVDAVAYTEELATSTNAYSRKVGYATLTDAVAAVGNNETVTLLKNITYTKETGFINGEYVDGLVYTGDKNFTVDFAGHTVTENGDINDYLVYLKNTGEKDNEITFKNGTIAIDSLSTATAWAAITVGSNSSTHATTLNLDSMKVINGNPNEAANQVIRSRNGATVNLNEGTTVTSNGTSYCVVAEAASTLNINDGAKVIQQNSGTTGGNTVYTAVSGNGVINIYEGAVIESDKYGIHNMTTGNTVINIYGGTITAPVIVRAATNGGSGESADVYISGGTFYGAMEEYTNTANIHVSGGVFDRPVAEEFCAEGYAPCDNEDGTYGVYYAVLDEVHFVDGEFTEYNNSRNMTVGTLTYERSSIPTTWTPFYVPFEVPVSQLAEQGFEVAYINGVRRDDDNYDGELDDFVMEVIYIHGGNADGSAKTLKANYPYFIRSKGSERIDLYIELEDALLYAAKNATYDCSTFTEKFEITGNASQIEINSTADALVYGVSGGGWTNITTGATLKPFRFYMTLTSRDGSAPVTTAASLSIVVRGEELPDGTTLIYDINAETGDNVIYDLNGRRVLETEKGNIYIINGKKVLVK